jgi:uncharacterized membrane protein YqjE
MQNNDGANGGDASTGELFKRLSEQTSTLVRQEVDLAKAELSEKGKQVGTGAGMFGTAGILGYTGFLAITAAIVLALNEALDGWLAALIVGAVYLAIAGAAALVGRDRIREATPAAPVETIETVKEDVQWAKNQARSARR